MLRPPITLASRHTSKQDAHLLAASTSSSPADASVPQASKPSDKATAQLEALLGVALEVHTAFLQRSKQGSLVKHTEAYLELARRAHCSPQVMTAVADFLGIVRG